MSIGFPSNGYFKTERIFGLDVLVEAGWISVGPTTSYSVFAEGSLEGSLQQPTGLLDWSLSLGRSKGCNRTSPWLSKIGYPKMDCRGLNLRSHAQVSLLRPGFWLHICSNQHSQPPGLETERTKSGECQALHNNQRYGRFFYWRTGP